MARDWRPAAKPMQHFQQFLKWRRGHCAGDFGFPYEQPETIVMRAD